VGILGRVLGLLAGVERRAALGRAMGDTHVVQLEQTRLLREGEAAAKRYKTRAGENRMDIFPMARGLHAARQIYASNQAFGDWLQKSEYGDIQKDDRAALIKLGELSSQNLLQFLGETLLVSPQLIWKEFSSSYDTKTIPVTQLKNIHPNQADLFQAPEDNVIKPHPSEWSPSYAAWRNREIETSLPRPAVNEDEDENDEQDTRARQLWGAEGMQILTRDDLPTENSPAAWKAWARTNWYCIPLHLRRHWWRDTNYGERLPSKDVTDAIYHYYATP
jgi:hypothetical protein